MENKEEIWRTFEMEMEKYNEKPFEDGKIVEKQNNEKGLKEGSLKNEKIKMGFKELDEKSS